MWTGPTLVTTAQSGRISAASGAISPGWFVPASKTPKRLSRGIARRLLGSPRELFQLPSVFAVGPSAPSRCEVSSLTVVLPALPVMPTTVGSTAARQPAASAVSAAAVPGTTSAGMPSGTTAPLSIITAAAPRSMAWRAKAWPSKVGPLMAT